MNEKYGIELDLITDGFTKKINQVKKQAESIKDAFNPNDVSGMKISGLAESTKEIKGISNEFKKLSGSKIDLGNAVELKNYKMKLQQVGTTAKQTKNDVQQVGYVKYNTAEIQKFVNEFGQVKPKAETGATAIKKVATETNKLGASKGGIKSLTSAFKSTALNGFIKGIGLIRSGLSKVGTIAGKLKSKMSNAFHNPITKGLGTLLKYAGTLFGLRTIYNVLQSSASAWLNSQNAQAQQLKANIDYMKYSMGSALAPVITYVTNLVYNLMKAVQSLVYAFTGINIFAKATASSMKSAGASAGKTAKEVSKTLAPFDELNNIDTQSDSGSGGGGSGAVSPTFDLTSVDSKFEEFSNKVKTKLMELFQPIQKSWATYGQPLINSAVNSFNQLKNLGTSVAKSLETVWLNGTGEETINLWLQGFTAVFDVIGNVAEALNNAWNNADMGTSIIQNLWSSFNDLFSIVVGIWQVFAEFTGSETFQTFATNIVKSIQILTGWFEKLTLTLKNVWDNGLKTTFEKILDVSTQIINIALEIINNVIAPIVDSLLVILEPAIQTIIDVINDALDIIQGLLDFIVGVFTGDWEKAWNGIKQVFTGVWNAIRDFLAGIIVTIVTFIKNGLSGILSSASIILTGIKNLFVGIWNGIKTVVSGVINVIKSDFENKINFLKSVLNGILNFVTGVFTGNWNRAWNGLKQVFATIINGMISGIERFVNGAVKGINVLLKGISSIANKAGDVLGWQPINLQLSTVSIPRLNVGTNYVPEDQLAMIHKGEAVVPKKFNSSEFFGSGNEETNEKLEQLIEAVQNIEINPYTTIKDVGKTAVNYINTRNRQIGGSVIA